MILSEPIHRLKPKNSLILTPVPFQSYNPTTKSDSFIRKLLRAYSSNKIPSLSNANRRTYQSERKQRTIEESNLEVEDDAGFVGLELLHEGLDGGVCLED